MPIRITSTVLLVAVGFCCCPAYCQEWTKKDAGRVEYVQDRTDCAQQAQQMALVGEELQRDITTCLASKGWQRNQADVILDLYCEERESIRACKRGGTNEIYKKERAECVDQVLKTVGNKYSRPGWRGLGGLIISSSQAEENKRNLHRAQISMMRICLEGKSWSVELKGEAAKAMAPDYIEQPAGGAAPSGSLQ